MQWTFNKCRVGGGERKDSKWGRRRQYSRKRTELGQNSLSLAFLPLTNLRVKICLTYHLHIHTSKQKASYIQVTQNQSRKLKYRSFTNMFTHHQASNYWQFQNLLQSSSQNALPFALKIFTASSQQPWHWNPSPHRSTMWRKVREEQVFLCRLLFHQKKSWGRHMIFCFTHHRQTNPQIWNPELTKALNPSGFEKGQCFFLFLLCYQYLHNKSL